VIMRVWLNRGRLSVSAGASSARRAAASAQAALIAAGSGGVMKPRPATIEAQSPMSVATGTAPHIMPSIRHSGAASPLAEVSDTTSAAA